MCDSLVGGDIIQFIDMAAKVIRSGLNFSPEKNCRGRREHGEKKGKYVGH
jgi:hypothetical protein